MAKTPDKLFRRKRKYFKYLRAQILSETLQTLVC